MGVNGSLNKELELVHRIRKVALEQELQRIEMILHRLDLMPVISVTLREGSHNG